MFSRFNVAPAGARNARTSEGDKYRGMLRRKFPWLGLKRKMKRSSKWKTRTDEISPQQSDKYINPPPDPRPRVVQALELVGQQIHCADLEKDGRKDVFPPDYARFEEICFICRYRHVGSLPVALEILDRVGIESRSGISVTTLPALFWPGETR